MNFGKLRLRFVSQTFTICSGCGIGSGRSRTPSMTLNIALLAPTPNPSASTAAKVNPGFFRSVLSANCRSWNRVMTRPSKRIPPVDDLEGKPLASHAILNLVRYEAILFDFDGVLVDSEPVHCECWQEILKPYGLQLDWKTYCEHGIGAADRLLLARLCQQVNPPVELDRLIPEYPKKRHLFQTPILAPSTS